MVLFHVTNQMDASSIQGQMEHLGCPLRSCWSWGAKHKTSDIYLLKCWDDELRRCENGDLIVGVIGPTTDASQIKNVHERERVNHVQAICNGAKGYAIFQSSRNVPGEPRKQGAFDRKIVWEIESIIWSSEGGFARLGYPISTEEFQRRYPVTSTLDQMAA